MGGPGRELSPELVDDAIAAGCLRAFAGELPDGGRISDEVIDELLGGARTEEEIVGPGGLLALLTKRLVERVMEVELTEYLGYESHQEPPGGAGNTRNGSTPKTLLTDHGPVGLEVGARFPVITQAWLDAWEHVIPFLAFGPEVRRVIYTTNAIEALNRQLRKGHFPNEDAARKLIYLAINNAAPAWTRTRSWTAALLAFKIHFARPHPKLTTQTPTQKNGHPHEFTRE